MDGNQGSASGLAGSDATTANQPPATSSTRTHNQAQLPPSTVGVAAAAIQNYRDDPHLAGNEACRCPSCHLKDNFFPRSRDGRIVLPHPSLSIHSARIPRSTTTSTSAGLLATPGLVTRKRNRADSTASNSDLRLSVAKFNQGRRRGGGVRTPHLQSDKGEGSSTGAGRMSANVEESWMALPHREVMQTDESQRTTRRSKPGSHRSFSGLSRRPRPSAKHDQQTERPDPWPRILEPEFEFAGQPSHLTQQSSQQSQPLILNTKSRLELLLDKVGTTRPQNLLQSQSSPQMATLGTPRLGAPSTAPQSHTGAYGHEHHHSIPSSLHDQLGPSMLSYPEPTDRLDTSYHQHHHRRRHDSASRPESPADTVHAAQDKPKIIRFSSRSENPQPTSNPEATTSTSGEENVHSSPITRDPPLPSSSSSSHQLQPPFEVSSSSSSSRGNTQTQFKFQEPVVPEPPTNTSPVHSRDLSIVQVKWDSERKRRQGYFAQEEGSEKSPFRHYNKANCDFES